MHRRKIQLIAGTTYSISLPKEWVKKNHLKEMHNLNDEDVLRMISQDTQDIFIPVSIFTPPYELSTLVPDMTLSGFTIVES